MNVEYKGGANSKKDASCPICGSSLKEITIDNDYCPGCKSAARTRSLPIVLENNIANLIDKELAESRPVLAFAMTDIEKGELSKYFSSFVSVSLFGNYGKDHIEGVDARDLSRFESDYFSAHFSILLFDYFVEMEEALREAYRVLAEGGVFFTYIGYYRLTDDDAPPSVGHVIKKRPDYFNYLPDEAEFISSKVGKHWFLEAMRRVGFEAQHVVIPDVALDIASDWFIGVKPASGKKSRAHSPGDGVKASNASTSHKHAQDAEPRCPICSAALRGLNDKRDYCINCGAASRTRSLPLLVEALRPLVARELAETKPVLAFAMTDLEWGQLSKIYKSFTSVSLYGDFRNGHIEGVDATDLSRFPEGSFSAHYSLLLFDYIEDMEAAAREAYRVLEKDGLFITSIGEYRLIEDNSPPKVDYIINKRPDYFEYLPDGATMPSMKVGKKWFERMLEEQGFSIRTFSFEDPATGMLTTWFVGQKKEDSRGKVNGSVEKGFSKLKRFFSKTGKDDFERLEKAYAIPIKIGDKKHVIRINLRSAKLEKEGEATYFAEHVAGHNHVSRGLVTALGVGRIFISIDNGESWQKIPVGKAERRYFTNAFTTSDGFHLVQAYTEREESRRNIRNSNPNKASIFIFSPEWSLVDIAEPAQSVWHGSASIDQQGDTIMFAEYPDNGIMYRLDRNSPEWAEKVLGVGVFRSRDNGRNWQKVFELEPGVVRHFHTLVADPHEPGVWWLSSGDRPGECRVWRSPDDGDSWEEWTNSSPDISLPPDAGSMAQAAFRYTDVVVGKEFLFWGADDYMGPLDKRGPEWALADRTGSRLYLADKKKPLRLREIGFCGHPVRSIVDIGEGYIITTEAKHYDFRPQVFFVAKEDVNQVLERGVQQANVAQHLMDLDNHEARPTGFSYSLASRQSLNGRFFTRRMPWDVFHARPGILQWDIEIEGVER